jgi:hypothetical protein
MIGHDTASRSSLYFIYLRKVNKKRWIGVTVLPWQRAHACMPFLLPLFFLSEGEGNLHVAERTRRASVNAADTRQHSRYIGILGSFSVDDENSRWQ